MPLSTHPHRWSFFELITRALLMRDCAAWLLITCHQNSTAHILAKTTCQLFDPGTGLNWSSGESTAVSSPSSSVWFLPCGRWSAFWLPFEVLLCYLFHNPLLWTNNVVWKNKKVYSTQIPPTPFSTTPPNNFYRLIPHRLLSHKSSPFSKPLSSTFSHAVD